ncbi:MAG: DUF2339 domain-containing protein, partial [Defluviitaleaceae bacterium]|nr:DUF2339 domain-containing protein [Defluviitaleaceae bacterium]
EALRRAYEKEIQERAGDELPSPEALEKRLRIFNFEMGFGTKAANILGLLLILLGVVFGLQYTYVHILRSDELRGAAAYFLGILFVVAGEILIRKQKSWVHDADDYMSHWTNTAFPTGLAAGGVAILFASTAVSYFVLGILSIPAAIVLCVGTSAVAFLLSIRYSSRTIACFALVGGYLPMTALEPGDNGMLVGAMVYFVLLTLLALLLASQRKWPIMNILSFVLSTIGAYVLAIGFEAPVLASVAYLSANFLMYLGIILIYPLRMAWQDNKKAADDASPLSTPLTAMDIIILSANTFINCVMIYSVLNRDGFGTFSYNGLLAIGFFAVYFAGAKLTQHFLPGDKRVSGLFYLTTLTFAILIIPMQLGGDWLLIGWLAEGVALIAYGVTKKIKGFERAGWLVTALGIGAFIVDWQWPFLSTWTFVNYTSLSLGLIVILAVYHYVNKDNVLFFHSQKGKNILAFQYVVVVQTLFYLLYTATFFYQYVLESPSQWLTMLLIMVALMYGLGIKYIPVIADRAISIISLCICGWAVFCALLFNLFPAISAERSVIALGLLVIFNLFSVFVVFDSLNTVRKLMKERSRMEWMSLAVSIYGLALVIMMLMVQYGHNANSLVLSAIGMVAAFLWITFGFTRRNRSMRLFGLVFSIFSLAKLFFVDLYFLPDGLRIVSYFIFGVIFLAISFVYQFFSKKLREEVDVNEA